MRLVRALHNLPHPPLVPDNLLPKRQGPDRSFQLQEMYVSLQQAKPITCLEWRAVCIWATRVNLQLRQGLDTTGSDIHATHSLV